MSVEAGRNFVEKAKIMHIRLEDFCSTCPKYLDKKESNNHHIVSLIDESWTVHRAMISNLA